MAVDLDLAKQQLNVTIGDDDALITQQLAAAKGHIGRLLGFAVDDATQFPDGTPADLDQAILLLVAHWYGQRETAFVNTAAQAIEIPFGVAQIVAEYRNFSFGCVDG